MKILFDAREGSRNTTGIGRYVRNLAREIRAYGDPQIACTFLPERIEAPSGRAVRSLPGQLINFFRNVTWKQVYLPARARIEKADLLVCMDPIGPLICPTRTAVIIYDLIFLSSRAQSDAWTRYWRAMVPRSARRADLVFTISRASKLEITKRLGVPEEKIIVIRAGLAEHFHPLSETPAEQAEARRRLGLPEAYLLTVGAHDPRRNLKTLLAAYRNLASKGSPAPKLVVVGQRTPYSQQVRETTRALGLEGSVLFLDYLSNEDLRRAYGLADLYVYPSSEEGFGLTPLEAMACGCPVVTSRVSSLPEVVGDAALLVNPTDAGELAGAMDRVRSDRELRKSLIRKGLERAKGFSWRAGAEDVVNACQRLVGERAIPPKTTPRSD